MASALKPLPIGSRVSKTRNFNGTARRYGTTVAEPYRHRPYAWYVSVLWDDSTHPEPIHLNRIRVEDPIHA